MKRTAILVLLAAVAATGCSMMRNVHAEATREMDEEQMLASEPDALVDALGEPDEWDRRREGDQLFMTALWSCVEGERREVTWHSRTGSSGRRYWVVVEDLAEQCDEEN